MDTIDFHPPPQHPPGKDAFDPRPAAVKAWIDQLPLGHLHDAARQLFEAIHQGNRQTMTVAERCGMMEALAAPLHEVLDGILQKLLGHPVPLPHKTRRLAEFTRQLLVEVVISYQVVLDGKQHGSWLYRLTHHRLWPLCIHRMLHYLGLIDRVQKVLHQPAPIGLWQAIHRLYLEAEEHGHRDAMVAVPWEQGRSESIESCYLQQQLSSLLEPGLFVPQTLRDVQRQLPHWARLVVLHPPEHWQPSLLAFWIRLDMDSPHTSPASQASLQDQGNAPALLLDLGAVHKAIREALDKPLDWPGAASARERETLAILSRAWRVPVGPREHRSHGVRPRQVAIGMSALYSLLRQEYGREDGGMGDADRAGEPRPVQPVADRPAPKKSSPSASVWDSIFFATGVGANAWSMSSEPRSYHYIDARELDHSKGGSCLEFFHEALQPLGVGELLGFRRQPDSAMQLFEVRWIQEMRTSVQVGVMLLADQLEPMLAVTEVDERCVALACLMGIGQDGHPQLFLPNLPGMAERRLALRIDGHEVPIELRERNAHSPMFVAHHIALPPSLQRECNLEESMDLQELKRRLHLVATGETARGVRDQDDFSDLWDSL